MLFSLPPPPQSTLDVFRLRSNQQLNDAVRLCRITSVAMRIDQAPSVKVRIVLQMFREIQALGQTDLNVTLSIHYLPSYLHM